MLVEKAGIAHAAAPAFNGPLARDPHRIGGDIIRAVEFSNFNTVRVNQRAHLLVLLLWTDDDKRIQAARRAVGQAGESLRVEREKFSRGRGTSNDLLLAEEALLRARTELAAALADNLIALAELRLASGYDPVDVAPGPDPPNSGRE